MTDDTSRWLRVATFVVGTGLWLASFALGVGGCSAMASLPPPTTRPMRFSVSECSDSYWPVIVDGYLAANTGAVALVGLVGAALVHGTASREVVPSWNQGAQGDSGVGDLLTVGVVATAATVALIQSARYGKRSADACETARRSLMYGWPPPPAAWYPPAVGAPR